MLEFRKTWKQFSLSPNSANCLKTSLIYQRLTCKIFTSESSKNAQIDRAYIDYEITEGLLFFFSNSFSRLIANFKFTLSFCLLNPEPSMSRDKK